MLVSRVESNTNQDLYVIDVQAKKVKHLTPHKDEAQYHSPSWSADGKTVYCISTAEGRMAELKRLVDQLASESEYFHTPTDANAGRA